MQIHLAASLHEQNAATAGQDCCFGTSTQPPVDHQMNMQESFDWAAVPTDGQKPSWCSKQTRYLQLSRPGVISECLGASLSATELCRLIQPDLPTSLLRAGRRDGATEGLGFTDELFGVACSCRQSRAWESSLGRACCFLMSRT